jgi:hypothetical protein
VCDLDHVEASIRLFKPDIDLEEIMPRPVPPPHAAFKGDVSRVLLDTLRKTTRPLTTRDLTLVLMRERGLNTEYRKLVRTMHMRTGASLNHWKRRGLLKATPAQDLKGMLLWEIADRPITDASYDPLTVPRLPRTG